MFKKLASIFIAGAMCVGMCTSVGATANNDLPSYTPVQSRVIIGGDDRVPATVTNKIVYISATFSNGKSYRSTGFMISSDTVMTAAHNIYGGSTYGVNGGTNLGMATKVVITPGKNGTSAPLGTITINNTANFHIPSGWTSSNVDFTKDYAFISLNSSINTGYFGVKLPSTWTGTNVTITGYPQEYTAQYTASGNINNDSNNLLYYSIDTTPGQSGSPIFIMQNGSPMLIGVHSRSTGGSNVQNVGVKITTDIFNEIVSYR